MIINKRKFLDYFLMILFIALSGVPYLVSPILNMLQFSLLFLIFILRRKTINKSFLLLFTILFVLTLLQGLDFNFFPIMTNIGLYILVLSAYFIVKILEDKFISHYIIVMYYVAIVSLFFFLPILLLPAIGYFFVDNVVPLFNSLNFAHSIQSTIIIYNFTDIDSFRNNGPYWEPGVFAGYLIIAFMFNVIAEKKIIERKNIVFFIAIITTTSTTAFLTMFVFLSFIYYKQIKNFIFKSITITSIIVISMVFTYLYSPFGPINALMQFFNIEKIDFLNNTDYALYAVILMTIWSSFGYYMLLFLASLQSIPEELYESADIDGASSSQKFWYITLPMLKPMLLFVIVINTIRSLQVFAEIFVMTSGGPAESTTTVVYYLYNYGFSKYNMGYAAAASYILFIIILIFTLIQFKLVKYKKG